MINFNLSTRNMNVLHTHSVWWDSSSADDDEVFYRWSARYRVVSSRECWYTWQTAAHSTLIGRRPSWCLVASCWGCVLLAATTQHVTSGVTSLPPTFDQSARVMTKNQTSVPQMVWFLIVVTIIKLSERVVLPSIVALKVTYQGHICPVLFN